MQSFKQERVIQMLSQEINTMIVMKEIKDPRVSNKVSVLHIKTSKDISFATVYISSYQEEKSLLNTVAALNHAKGFIQSKIAKKYNWRQTPKLLFKASDGLRNEERIIKALKLDAQKTAVQNTDVQDTVQNAPIQDTVQDTVQDTNSQDTSDTTS